MKKLNDTERAGFNNIISFMNEKEIEYVVLRSYFGLPDELNGSDIDILIETNEFKNTMQHFENVFSVETTDTIIDSTLEIFSEICNSPIKIYKGVRDPSMAFSYLSNKLSKDKNPLKKRSQYDVKSATITIDELDIDFYNHLSYYSPYNGRRRRVEPTVEKSMLLNRKRHNSFYIPSPPDELAHLIGRVVFDFPEKGKEIPTRYCNRIDELTNEIKSQPRYKELFELLLEHMFFGASEYVFERIVHDDAYADLHRELRGYDNY